MLLFLMVLFLCNGVMPNDFDYDSPEYYGDYANYGQYDQYKDITERNIFKSGGFEREKQCGQLKCRERVGKVFTDSPDVIIPNAFNITCVRCYNSRTRAYTKRPINQQREVRVFERVDNNLFRFGSIRQVNDGCKCPRS